MNKEEVMRFFDAYAAKWDEGLMLNHKVVQKIMDYAHIEEGVDVLDVACGTGVLFPAYLERNVGSLTGIDISAEMVKIARKKFPDIEIICGDAETFPTSRKFDRIIVYNAFPHFPNPEELIAHLADLLKAGGILSIAHGMSRDALLKHHGGKAQAVSLDLPELNELVKICNPYFHIETAVSNEEMYQVTAIKKV